MPVQQIQSHCGDTSSANELGLTAVGQTESLRFIFLLARRLKETGKGVHVKPGNKRQGVPTRYSVVSSCSSIVRLQEHQDYIKKGKKFLELFQEERSARDPTREVAKDVVLSQLL